MAEFTSTERELLRRLASYIGPCIASPDWGIRDLRDCHGSGGGHGFTYRVTRSALSGWWHEWIPTEWAAASDRRPEGTPIKWRSGALLQEATVSYARLHQWCTALPAAVREQALVNYRTAPIDTRDLVALDRITLAAIDASDPQPALFELQGAPRA